jgi:hypothetical protein
MAKGGSVVWNEEFKAWVVYVVAPGALGQNEDLVPIFEHSIQVFAEKLNLLGYRRMVKSFEAE